VFFTSHELRYGFVISDSPKTKQIAFRLQKARCANHRPKTGNKKSSLQLHDKYSDSMTL